MSPDDLACHADLLGDLLVVPASGLRSDRGMMDLLAEVIVFLNEAAPLLAEIPEQLPGEIVFHVNSVSQGDPVDNMSTL